MSALQFPCTIFKTRKGMDDYGASDMRCGDLTEEQLKSHFLLRDISSKVDPYTLTKMTPFSQPRLESSALQDKREKIGRHECARILFDEFRYLSRAFAVYGPYRHLIEKMINHMQIILVWIVKTFQKISFTRSGFSVFGLFYSDTISLALSPL